MFDDIKETMGIYRTEKRIVSILSVVTICQSLIIIVLLVGTYTLFPLKENVPYLVRFSNASQNFVEVTKANGEIKEDKYIRTALAVAYVINAESKNNIDDKARQNIVRLQSDFKIWKQFKSLYTAKESIFSNVNLSREINIITVNLIPNTNIAQIDFQSKLRNSRGDLLSTSNFRAVFKFRFEALVLKYNEIGLNPTGFKVTNYSLSKIGN